jgi:glycosyltransferase involved in cell wall biosynthesis
MVTVSVCIPAYNQIESFKRAFESVISQEYFDYEIIVTDDSTNDDISNYLQSRGASQAVRYYKNLKRLGAPANWNQAISLATGKYIKILHHDDWLSSPSALQKFIAPLEINSDVALAFCAIQNVHIDGSFKVHRPPLKNRVTNKDMVINLLMGNWIGPPSSVIYRNSGNMRFDENLQWLVDVDFYIRQGSMGEILFIDEILVCGTFGGKEQLSRSCENNPDILIYEHFYLLDKLKLYFSTKSYKTYLATLQRVVARFAIDNSMKIFSYGYKGDIPSEIISFMKLVKNFPMLSRVYAKTLEFFRKLS